MTCDAPTPRILIISCATKKLSSLSPFQRKEGCDRLGKATRCHKLRDGKIAVEFAEEKDAGRALAATEFAYTARDDRGKRLVKLPISVSAHRTKNSSRGIIYCADLEDVSDDDIAEGLSDYGVVSARQIISRRAGTPVATHNIILTFNQVDTPRDVKVCFVRVQVRPYIPSPMRCFKCLKFGRSPPMGPPPPPPPLRRPPPPPLQGAAAKAQPPTVGPKQPVGRDRPVKRSLPWEVSPTEGDSPRARQRVQPHTKGRSSSVDGRLRQERARKQFGEGYDSGSTQYF